MVPPGSDAAVFLVREAGKILAATTDCNGLFCSLDPREGARLAVAEAARNLTCSGASLLAVTDNLNFGNPYKPENFWQLRESIEGLAEACAAFGTPVTGGNVSLYNESPAGAVDPTPTVGMVGIIERERDVTTQNFKAEGDVILLVGGEGAELGASHYMKVIHDRKEGLPPRLDIEREIALQQGVLALIRSNLVSSAHDCSEGGLAVALAECCISGRQKIGAAIDFGTTSLRADQLLFNESASRVIISVTKANASAACALLQWRGITVRRIGAVGGKELSIATGGARFSWPVTELHCTWYSAIHDLMSA